MKLFLVVIACSFACSFTVHADNYESCSAKNKFDYKDKGKPHNLYDENVKAETKYAHIMQTLDEAYNTFTLDFDSFEEGVRIQLDHILKLSKTRREKIAEIDDLRKECAEKYSAEVEAVVVNTRKAFRDGLATLSQTRPILDELARLVKDLKALLANCWSSSETPCEAVNCIAAKDDEINDNKRKMFNMWKGFNPTLKKRHNVIKDVIANFRKKVLTILKKAEQCFGTE